MQSQIDTKTVLPNYLAKEYIQATKEARHSLCHTAHELIQAQKPRAEVIEALTSEGWSEDISTWIYSQVKAKGPELQMFVHDDSGERAAAQAAHEERVADERKFWLRGILAILISPLAALVFLPRYKKQKPLDWHEDIPEPPARR